MRFRPSAEIFSYIYIYKFHFYIYEKVLYIWYAKSILSPEMSQTSRKPWKTGFAARLPGYVMFLHFKTHWDCHVI